MKKIIVSLLLVFSLFSVFGATIDPFKIQTISGFIDDISYLYVSPFTFDYIGSVGYAGINLDYTETSSYNELIRPTQTALSMPGVQMGSFSALATYTQSSTIQGVRLTITHTKLIHTTAADAAELEYELAVLYAMGDGTNIGSEEKKYCLSSDAAQNNRIVIDLQKDTKIASIQNGHIYFRLAQGVTKNNMVTGQYESIVTFTMEAI